MKRLYYDNQYLKEFVAEIEDIRENSRVYDVVLDKTAFFPGGGGQHCDLGTIDNNKVINVYERYGVIYHTLEKKPLNIHNVKCEIDWNRRLDGMQQHLGQHVLSGCFFTMFNKNTVSVHVGSNISTVDIKGYLNEETIRFVEKMANEIIQDNLVVEFLTPTKKDLKKLNLRRDLPKTNDQIRVVKIGELDINACCGVHPKSTLELQCIKIKRWEKHKGDTRIEYLVGKRAIDDYFNKSEFRDNICKYLKCGENDAINAIIKTNNKVKELKDENRNILDKINEYKITEMIRNAEMIGNISIIKRVYKNENIKNITKLIDKLTANENIVALLGVKFKDRVNLIYACSKNITILSMNDLLKDSIILIDGRGGGSKVLAQGSGKNGNNLENAMDYSFRKIKEKVN